MSVRSLARSAGTDELVGTVQRTITFPTRQRNLHSLCISLGALGMPKAFAAVVHIIKRGCRVLNGIRNEPQQTTTSSPAITNSMVEGQGQLRGLADGEFAFNYPSLSMIRPHS